MSECLFDRYGEMWELRREEGLYVCEEDQCPKMARWELLAAESDGVRFLCTLHTEEFFCLLPGTLAE